MEIDFDGVDIDVSYGTIFKVLREILIEDYGLDKPGMIMTKDMIVRILTDLKVKYDQEDVDETVKEKLTPKKFLESWDLDWEIYNIYYHDNIDVIKEYVEEHDSDDYSEQMYDYYHGDHSPDGFSSFEAFKEWQNGKL